MAGSTPKLSIFATALLGALVAVCGQNLTNSQLDLLAFNQIQAIATSKSFHLAPPQAVLDLMNTSKYQTGVLDKLFIPQSFVYNHTTITEQLNMGILNFELWIMDDYTGGRYAYSAGAKLAGLNGTLSDPTLMQPGYKILSMADWDYGSTVYLLDNFIKEVLQWTATHPNHLPLVVVVHPATSGVTGDVVTDVSRLRGGSKALKSTPGLPQNFTDPQALGDGNAFAADIDLQKFDATLRKLVPATKLFTPDKLRGTKTTLREAVFPPNGSWPTIASLRNTIMFVADPGFLNDYLKAFPGLKNASMFPSNDASSDNPNVVFLDVEVDTSVASGLLNTVSFNNEISSSATKTVDDGAANIKAQVEQGFIVRAAVDRNLVEAYHNYIYRLQQFATVGGAQYLMTATEVVQPAIPNSTYSVNPTNAPGFSGGPAVCNPVTTSVYSNSTASLGTNTTAVGACPYHLATPANATNTTSSPGNGALAAGMDFIMVATASILLAALMA